MLGYKLLPISDEACHKTGPLHKTVPVGFYSTYRQSTASNRVVRWKYTAGRYRTAQWSVNLCVVGNVSLVVG